MKVFKFFLMVAMVVLAIVGGFNWIVMPRINSLADEISLTVEVNELKNLQRERDRLDDLIRCLSVPSFSDGVQAEKLRYAKRKSLEEVDREIKNKEALILSKKSP
jgi:hypothetical protein